MIEGSNLFVKSKHCCASIVSSCPARMIKYVPPLLHTAVSLPTLYSVTEKSSHFLCPVFCK